MSGKKKKEDEPGVAAAIGVGAAVLVGAGLAFGAKKLFDYWNSLPDTTTPCTAAAGGGDTTREKSCCDSDSDEYESSNHHGSSRSSSMSGQGNATSTRSEEGRSRSRNARSRDAFRQHAVSYSIPPANASSSSAVTENFGARPKYASAPEQPTSCDSSLSVQLHNYYTDYVDISQFEMKAARKAAEYVKDFLFDQFGRSVPAYPEVSLPKLLELRMFGSTVDESQVINPQKFDVMMLFDVSDEQWTVDTHESRGTVVRTSMPSAGSGLVDTRGTLLWSELNNAAHETIQQILLMESDLLNNYILMTKNHGSSIEVEIEYMCGAANRQLSLLFIPAVQLTGRSLIRKVEMSTAESSYWQTFNFDHELNVLDRFWKDTSTVKQLFKILKAISLNNAKFAFLSTYQLKTLMLNVVEEQSSITDWTSSTLAERFIDLLVELGSCCKEKVLTDYFEKSVNLFADTKTSFLQELALNINAIIGRNDFVSLFERNCRKL